MDNSRISLSARSAADRSIESVNKWWNSSSAARGVRIRYTGRLTSRWCRRFRSKRGCEEWRRGGDSNSRDAYTPNSFRDYRIQPLCHLSAGCLNIRNLPPNKFLKNRSKIVKGSVECRNPPQNRVFPPPVLPPKPGLCQHPGNPGNLQRVTAQKPLTCNILRVYSGLS